MRSSDTFAAKGLKELLAIKEKRIAEQVNQGKLPAEELFRVQSRIQRFYQKALRFGTNND